MEIITPWLTCYREHPDHDAQDKRRETEQLFQRQGAIEDLLEGRGHVDVVLDLLEEQGVDAAAYADEVHAQVTAIIDSGVVYLSNEAGLLLPQGFVE